jgi:hypothetical protein
MAIGNELDSNVHGPFSGAVYVYRRDGERWQLITKLLPSDGTQGQHFGSAIDLEGTQLAIGAEKTPKAELGQVGAVYVFELRAGAWIESAKVVPFDGEGRILAGASLQLSGDSLLVGASGDISPASPPPGAGYLYRRGPGGWTTAAKIVASDGLPSDAFGYAVSLDGATAIFGAPGVDDLGTASGSAYVVDLSALLGQDPRR